MYCLLIINYLIIINIFYYYYLIIQFGIFFLVAVQITESS